jgi:hypothetical protein
LSDNGVTVRLPGENQAYTVNGRVANIIRYLLLNYERVTAPTRVQISFDCVGSKVTGVKYLENERLETE